jgi:branched-chain amino acid transport system permease protein
MKHLKIISATLCILLLLIAPKFLDDYFMYLINLACIHIILAAGLNFLTGCSGQVSLGHAGFYGIGAYTSALLIIKLKIPFWFSMPLGGLAAALVGFCIGIPALRLAGFYLALVTLGFNEIIHLVSVHWDSLTQGTRGLMLPAVSLGAYEFSSDNRFYYIILPITIFLLWVARNLMRSKIGRALIALRESEIASQCLGMNTAKFKVIAFALSAFYAGLAGGIYGSWISYISPDNFGLLESFLYIMMVIIGGLGSLIGSVIGAILFTLLPELLRAFKDLQDVIYGALLLVFIIFMPQGIYGLFVKLIKMLSRIKAFQYFLGWKLKIDEKHIP